MSLYFLHVISLLSVFFFHSLSSRSLSLWWGICCTMALPRAGVHIAPQHVFLSLLSAVVQAKTGLITARKNEEMTAFYLSKPRPTWLKAVKQPKDRAQPPASSFLLSQSCTPYTQCTKHKHTHTHLWDEPFKLSSTWQEKVDNDFLANREKRFSCHFLVSE